MEDPWHLQRFVAAQEPVMARVFAELRAGRKRSHWMWFVFPQLRALGRSGTARRYGIASLDEARAYFDHAVLGPRLVECAGTLLGVAGRTADEIFGSPDDLKLRSSMTLFAAASPGTATFGLVLDKYYGGAPDPLTLTLLAGTVDSANTHPVGRHRGPTPRITPMDPRTLIPSQPAPRCESSGSSAPP